MIPLENFFDDVKNRNIIAKAKTEKLWIRKLEFRKYRVLNRKKYANKKRTVRHGIYDVTFFEDRDGQRFGHCTCPAGNPQLDKNGIPLYELRACYHLAAVYEHHLKVARKAKERELLKAKKAEVKKPVLVLCSFVRAEGFAQV